MTLYHHIPLPRQRPRIWRSQGQKLAFVLIAVLTVTLWAPAITSPGESAFNLSIFVAVAVGISLLFTQGFMRPPVASAADGRSIIIITFCMISLAFLSLLSITYAEQPFRVFRVAAGQAFGFAILYGILNLPQTPAAAKRIVNLLIWCATISGGYAVLAYVYPPVGAIAFGTSDRTAAFFKHANQFGMALSLTMPLLAAACINDQWKLKRLVQLGLIVLGVIFSGSKTNMALSLAGFMVVVVAGAFIGGTLHKRPGVVILSLVAAAIAVAVAPLILVELNPRAYRLISATASGETIHSMNDRLAVWDHSIRVGLAQPLTGAGAGQMVGVGTMPHSHNVFIEYLRTLGFPGLILITLFIVTVLGLCLRELRSALLLRSRSSESRVLGFALVVSIFSYLAANQLSDSFGPSTLPLFWTSLALLLFWRSIHKNGKGNFRRS